MKIIWKILLTSAVSAAAGVFLLRKTVRTNPTTMLSTGRMTQNGLNFIMQNEGLRLTAYQDVAGVWTIGYGHTGSEVKKGMTITSTQAEAYLASDVSWAEQAVRQATASVTLTQNQFEALVDFCYNVGKAAFTSSTLLKRVKANPNDKEGISAQFLRWVYAGGKVSNGLKNRRNREITYYFS